MNLILIGMPGCGKSTIGVILAKSLAYDFIDSDLLIQRRAGGMTLQAILDQQGQDAFRALENRVNASIDCDHTVIATGGSVIYCPEAMEHLRSIGMVLYLRVAYEEIARRVGDFHSRGVVLASGQDLRALYEERLPLYERWADHTVDWTGQSAEQLVAEIVQKLTK